MNLIDGLNIEYICAGTDTLEAKMNLTNFHSQAFGILHGGALISLGETVAGYASKQIIDKDQAAIGQTITANHMKSKKIGYSFQAFCLRFTKEKNYMLSNNQSALLFINDSCFLEGRHELQTQHSH